MKIEKSLKNRLALQICFLLMTCVFLFNNLVQPLCDNMKVESTELMKDVDEEKTEKEKEGQDTDEYITYSITAQQAASMTKLIKPININRISDYYGDIYTPPPEFI